jgi:hypothetical protein
MRAQRVWGSDIAAPGDVVRHLVAMQAQEHRYARWSVAQRMKKPAGAAAVDAAFDEGTFVRTHVLRPTWHYVAATDLRWLLAFSAPFVLQRTVRRRDELELDARTLQRTNDIVATTVADGSRTRQELRDAIERRGVSAQGQRLPHMLMHAELCAVVCSGPMRAKQHTYAAFDARASARAGPSPDEAAAELARRYFASHGPALLQDFVWWAGLPVPTARAALADAAPHLESRQVDDRTYWFGEWSRTAAARLRADLVQVYDETIVAYRTSRDVVSSDSSLFERGLGFMHSVLVDGQLAGRWRVGKDGGVETRFDRRLSQPEHAAVDAAIARYLWFAGGHDPR